MSVDPKYIEAAVESLDLIHRLVKNLKERGEVNKLSDFLAQIETKADARVSNSLSTTLGIAIPTVDNEGKSPIFWEGIRDMARLATRKWQAVNKDPVSFSVFLTETSASLHARIGPEETNISKLEGILQGSETVTPKAAPSPLEDMLSSQPAPAPTPVAEPVRVVEPTPSVETISRPSTYAEPSVPDPEPIRTPDLIPSPTMTPDPIPSPVIPREEQKVPDVTPITPRPSPKIPDISPAPDKVLGDLGKKLESSEMVEAEPDQRSSLAGMILSKEDDQGDKADEDDDMLSLSLREALKILRDEDND